MKRYRTYGKPPFSTALLHGGPGAPGEMAPAAAKLSEGRGVIEPLQSADTPSGQVAELAKILSDAGTPPFSIAGFSWGAWLALLFAADSPELMTKLVLVGCPPLEEGYADDIPERRMRALDPGRIKELFSLTRRIETGGLQGTARVRAFRRLAELTKKADIVSPVESGDHVIEYQPAVFRKVWDRAAELRRTGELLGTVGKLSCPLIVIHGDKDPHPFRGVRAPLEEIGADAEYYFLDNCGHYPWLEKDAEKEFYGILEKELG